ncbi:2-phosphosulfolactate phosphatase [Dethiosulfatarculus sandiegensis]|uniref:Probable 2-phosphosulfolactate phosphatase n=1 Tax=Dethiosulfatarculus sandiegensis TaxID=1429043 RepID=A0A0D2JQQ5_9BACT|nr:2-phosphosulfolactate phosphatase [Dethiosulfatarculus sandiegensis]KIX11835.1 hypothetical protein X474_22425 [Dethiosulfatarculus sandiegensis]
MRIEVVKDLNRAEALTGVVVVFDVFRASNTIISLLSEGASKVFLFSGLEEAREFKEQNPDYLLLGERDGLAPPGFEGGNSPCSARSLDLAGRRVILTTSAGTQSVHRLGRARAVFFGSFANAAFLARHIRSMNPDEVHLLPMGLNALSPAVEDDEAAWWLARLLKGEQPDFTEVRPKLMNCDGADRLRSLNQVDDLEFCTSPDTHDLIAEVHMAEPPWAGAV